TGLTVSSRDITYIEAVTNKACPLCESVGKIIGGVAENLLKRKVKMRKISLLFAIIVLLAGVSVQAQKRGGGAPLPIGPPVPRQVSVQDQDGGGFIVFDLATGDFKCNMCEYKYAFSGPGQVKIDGFNVYLSAVTDTYEVFVTLNLWDRQGKAMMEVYSSATDGTGLTTNEGIREFWTDVNIDNNTLNCALLQPKK